MLTLQALELREKCNCPRLTARDPRLDLAELREMLIQEKKDKEASAEQEARQPAMAGALKAAGAGVRELGVAKLKVKLNERPLASIKPADSSVVATETGGVSVKSSSAVLESRPDEPLLTKSGTKSVTDSPKLALKADDKKST